MDVVWEELTSGLRDARQMARVLVRLVADVLLGAAVGIEREVAGKPAGLRTHMIVTLGTAVFVLACSAVGMSSDGPSRVIQGVVTGIGFIGAGSILKLSVQRDVQGLTTAASVWVAAAAGVAAVLGALGVALLATLFTLIILALAGLYDWRAARRRQTATAAESSAGGWPGLTVGELAAYTYFHEAMPSAISGEDVERQRRNREGDDK